MTDLEERIKSWTDAATGDVTPVSVGEVEQILSRPPNPYRRRALLVGALSIVGLMIVIGLAIRSSDQRSTVTAGRPPGRAGVGTGDSSTPAGPTPNEPDDYDSESLLSDLEGRGADARRVNRGQEARPALLRTTPIDLCVRQRTVRVYEYGTAEDRQAVSALISNDGSRVPTGSGWAIVEWVDPPRFYASGRIIVLYLGPLDDVAQLLAGLLGPTLSPDATAGGDGVDIAAC